MPSCIVKWCKNNSTKHKKHSGISYYTFPQNPIRREKWIKAVRLERREPFWIPSRSSKICSIHFKEDETYRSKKGRYNKLRDTAVPVCTMVKSLPSSRGVLKKSLASNGENFLQPENNLPFPCIIVCSSVNQPIIGVLKTCSASNYDNVVPIGGIIPLSYEHLLARQCSSSKGTQEKISTNAGNILQPNERQSLDGKATVNTANAGPSAESTSKLNIQTCHADLSEVRAQPTVKIETDQFENLIGFDNLNLTQTISINGGNILQPNERQSLDGKATVKTGNVGPSAESNSKLNIQTCHADLSEVRAQPTVKIETVQDQFENLNGFDNLNLTQTISINGGNILQPNERQSLDEKASFNTANEGPSTESNSKLNIQTSHADLSEVRAQPTVKIETDQFENLIGFDNMNLTQTYTHTTNAEFCVESSFNGHTPQNPSQNCSRLANESALNYIQNYDTVDTVARVEPLLRIMCPCCGFTFLTTNTTPVTPNESARTSMSAKQYEDNPIIIKKESINNILKTKLYDDHTKNDIPLKRVCLQIDPTTRNTDSGKTMLQRQPDGTYAENDISFNISHSENYELDGDVRSRENTPVSNVSSSDVNSMLDSPKTQYYMRLLEVKKALCNKRRKQISTLQRAVKRLREQVKKHKKKVKDLKKKDKKDTKIHIKTHS